MHYQLYRRVLVQIQEVLFQGLEVHNSCTVSLYNKFKIPNCWFKSVIASSNLPAATRKAAKLEERVQRSAREGPG